MREILHAVLSTETNPLLLVGSVQVGDEQTVAADSSTPAFLSTCREPSILTCFSFGFDVMRYKPQHYAY